MTVLVDAECPFDVGQGELSFLRTSGGTVVIFCDECQCVWRDPERITKDTRDYQAPRAPEYLIAPDDSIANWNGARPATEAEVHEAFPGLPRYRNL